MNQFRNCSFFKKHKTSQIPAIVIKKQNYAD